MKYYLYGAAIQGIQSFIFQTNELKEIAENSETVENICTKMFDKLIAQKYNLKTDGSDEEFEKSYKKLLKEIGAEKIIAAAGNVKYIFSKLDDCEHAVINFPRMVMTAAPGITISQAVEVFEDSNTDFGTIVNNLEKKLRWKRNCIAPSLTAGLLGMKRDPKTGQPILIDTKTSIDYFIPPKKLRGLCQKSFGFLPEHKEIAYNVEDITDKNDWIAIIHADGNSLGQVVQKVGHKKDEYREFSEQLDQATIQSANDAYDTIKKHFDGKKVIPIRPVVLGGDDMTVIIRGDLAIDYVTEYIKAFEENTRKKIGRIIKDNNVFDDGTDCLSACAGVAFIKSSYPFYYGYDLAENLCSEAKKVAKSGLEKNHAVKSCLMFHKVQDSFVTKYSDIVKRELSPRLKPDGSPNNPPQKEDGKPSQSPQGETQEKPFDQFTLKFGPYYIDEQDVDKGYQSIGWLKERADRLDLFDGVKTGIRQWLTLLHDGNGRASQHLKRLKEINKDVKENGLKASDLIDDLTNELKREIRTYEATGVRIKYQTSVAAEDCLTLYTIKNQETNEKDEQK